jgi:hypothetical protein
VLKRKALAAVPSFSNAQLVGAKSVAPVVSRPSSSLTRPVFSPARISVENLCGKSEMSLPDGGGGTRMLSTPWMTPLEASWRYCVSWHIVYAKGSRTRHSRC